jgi:taurine dioxygenase
MTGQAKRKQKKGTTVELRTRPLQKNFGLEVLDVDLAHLDDATFDAIYRLWQKDPLLLFRRQSLSERELVAYSRGFGDLDLIVRADMHSPLHPEVIYISALKRPDGTPLGGLGSYELHWHHDQIYRTRPASGSIFQASEMPENDGRTSWCNTALAWDSMPAALRKKIEGKRATAKYGNRADVSFQRDFAGNDTKIQELHDKTPAATHDIVLTNPATGQRSLFLDPNKTCAIEGLDAAGTRALLDEVFAHVLQDKFIYTHSWRNGDVVMWDNARLLHRREPFNEKLPRLAKRTTIFLRPKDFAVPEPGLA